MGKAVKKHDRKKTKKAMRTEAAQKKRPAPSSTSTEAQKRQNKMAARATSRTTAQSKKSAATKTTNTTQHTGAPYKTQKKPSYTPPQSYKPDSKYVLDSSYRLKAEEEYRKLCRAPRNKLDLGTLVRAGVTQQDIQAVLDRQATDSQKLSMINQMTGATNDKMASWADRVTGSCHGDCLSGIQKCFVGIYGDEKSPLNKYNPVWDDYRRVEDKNSACSAPMVLKRSGDFLTLSIPNYASYDYKGTVDREAANQRMNRFNNGLKPGTLACASGRPMAPYHQGATPPPEYGNSAIHGHIWIRSHNGKSCSDGVQSEINFRNYGPKVDISISMDAIINEDLAKALLEEKERRITRTQQQSKSNSR